MTGVDAVAKEISELPPRARLMFQPLVKRAMGTAVGLVLGGGIFLVTIYTWLLGNEEGAALIGPISAFFHGYDVNFTGALVGLFWGGFSGFVMGWFFAFVRNFVVACWILTIKTKAQLEANRDFLDHI